MSDVKMVKRVMVGASVSVLAGLLMSSAVLAEDDAALAEGEVSITVEEVQVDPVPEDLTVTQEGEGDPASEEVIRTLEGEGEPVPEDIAVTQDGEVDPELGDPVCIDCSGAGPDVSIDPIELEGEVIVEETQNDVPVTTTAVEKSNDAVVKPREDRETTRAARSEHPGETPRWLKKLFKIK